MPAIYDDDQAPFLCIVGNQLLDLLIQARLEGFVVRNLKQFWDVEVVWVREDLSNVLDLLPDVRVLFSNFALLLGQ
jgi:hypothetical protein